MCEVGQEVGLLTPVWCESCAAQTAVIFCNDGTVGVGVGVGVGVCV